MVSHRIFRAPLASAAKLRLRDPQPQLDEEMHHYKDNHHGYQYADTVTRDTPTAMRLVVQEAVRVEVLCGVRDIRESEVHAEQYYKGYEM